ncbi:MAG: aminotransferase class I/II-fold pyridoxal phosphate-dependent enzyme [Desulfobacteraceae bacterium]|nr:aminotransferase class I/II-fold pyridoxal phosphate-dependent enzyme [Desulfobacteraceae bacterium]
MNPLALELNQMIEKSNPAILSMLSSVGRQLFFPKGILSQSAEAKQMAHKINATIGIAKENNHTMCFDSVMSAISGVKASEALTYAPSFGIPALRKRWQKDLFAKNPSLKGKTISLPVVTCGITHAVSTFADMWVDAQDVIILPDKLWGNYNMIFGVRNGARLSHFPLFNEQDGFNLSAFKQTIEKEAANHEKIVVLLNFPQNPTGYSISNSEADEIVRILKGAAEKGARIIAVLDDAYFGLFYDEQVCKESLFARLCGQHPNLLAVKLDGATKENFVWGLRIGFITYGLQNNENISSVYEALEKKSAGSIRGCISNASHLGQTVLLQSLQDERNPEEKQEKFTILKRRALKVKQVLADSKYQDAWKPYPFNSGYFMCLKLKKIKAEHLRSHLLEKYGVGLIALGDYDLRVAFSCIDEDQINDLFDTILQGVRDLENVV